MRHFTHTFILTLLILIGLTISINLLVDPYERFNLISIKGFNAEKYNGGSRIVKANAIIQHKYNTLIMGTSRSEIGFSTNHPSWQNTPVYNLSLAGVSMTELYKAFNYALIHNKPKTLFLSLDLLMFNQKNTPNPEFYQSLFSGKNQWLDNIQSLLKFNTLNQSRKTFRRNIQKRKSYFTAQGQENGYTVFTGLIGIQGQRNLFWRALTKQYISSTYKEFTYDLNQLKLLKNLIVTCQKEGIKLYLVIPPIHALQLETIVQMGLWDTLEQWKIDLVNATNYTGTPVYDFTSWIGINAENLPSAADKKSRMHWYWEASHFKEGLGDKVISRVLDMEYDKNFGVRLTQKNIKDHLKQQRLMRSKYIKTHPDDIHDLWKLLEKNSIDIKVDALDNPASKLTFPAKVIR